MDKNNNSKLSYEELLKKNTQLENQVKEIERKSKKVEDKYLFTEKSRHTIEKLNNSGSWELDLINHKQTWSENYCLLLGYKEKIQNPDEQLFLSHIYPKDLDIVKTAMQKSMAEQEPMELEFRYVTKDGTIRYAHSKAEYIFDEKNNIIKIIGSFQDITEHRENENLIKSTKSKAEENENKYKNIIESSPLGIFLYTLEEDKLIFNGYNKSAENILGLDLKSLIGKTIEQAFPALVDTEIPLAYKKVAQTGEEYFTNQVDYDFDKIKGAYEVRAYQVSPNNIAVKFSDITERLKQEEDLKESQQKFKSLYDNIEEGVAIHKMLFDKNNNPIDFIWVDVNPKYEELTQLKRADIIGKKGKDIIHTIERRWYELYSRVTLTGTPETTIDHSEYLDKHWEVKAFRPYKGHFATAMTDVTEKVKAEEKIKKSESIQRKMVSNIGDVIVIIDKNGINRYKSPNVKKHFGWEVDDLVGISTWDKIHPKDVDGSKKILSSLASEPNKTVTTEIRYLHKNGEYRWIRMTITNMLDDPEIKGFLGNYYDVNESVIYKQNLEESEAKFRSYIDNSPNGVFITNENGKYIEVNKAACHITGYSEQELLGMTISELLNKSELNKGLSHFKEMKEKGSASIEVGFVTKSGENRIWDVAGVSLSETRFLGFAKDITAQKNAQLELLDAKEKTEENKNKYLSFIENVPAGVVVHDKDTSVLFNNHQAEVFLGLDSEQMRGRIAIDPHWKFVYEDNSIVPIDDYPVMRVLTNQKTLENQIYGAYRSHDDLVWLIVNGFPIVNSNNEIAQVIISFIDISKQKENELLLKGRNKELRLAKEKAEENEQILNTTLQTAMDGYWITDLKGNLVEVNNAYCQMSGYSMHELLKMNISDLEAIESTDDIELHIKQIKQKGETRFERKHRHKNGSTFDVVVSVKYQDFEGGQMVCFLHDITNRKRDEDELILNEKRLDALLELNQMTRSSLNEIYAYSLEKAVKITGSKIGFLGFVNEDKSKVNIFNWSGSAMRECNVENYGFEFDVEESGIWGEVVRSGKPLIINDYSAPNPMKRGTPIGHVKLVNYLSIPIYLDAKMVAIVSVGNKVGTYNDLDIKQLTLLLNGTLKFSQEQNYKKELKTALAKAKESDRLKSAFLANMSHEIRTPMNGILGFTSLLQEANLSVENQKNYIDIIEKSGDRLLNTVNDIIEISRIESGEINVTKSKVDIIGYLNTLVTFFRPEAKKKNIDIIIQNNIDENYLSIQTDENKLSSILSNLIKNAIKFTDEGTIKVGLKVENNQVLFSCQDTGIGIPKSRLEAIFNRFEQADIDDKHAHQGSGLGLAIVKSYVEILNGKIWVESEVGKGSAFYVSLPYKHEKKTKLIIPHEVKSNDSGIKNINVLVVEDDEFSSMHLLAILNGKVKNICTAINGLEAIDACKNDSGIDLILMDMKMPVMGGIEATKKIRVFNKDVIIIAQTAYALEGDREKALDAGCNDYISKPIKKDKLFELMNKYF